MKYLLEFLMISSFLLFPISQADGYSTNDKYDFWFRKYTLVFFSRSVDWEWFKAQAMAESSLDPTAKSPVGAIGIMQIMPYTGKDLCKRLNVDCNLSNPRINIMLGIYYDRKLWNNWRARRSEIERLRLTFASYNAGLGNILKAQKLAKKKRECNYLFWRCIKRYLKYVTGRHADETIDYVERIMYNYAYLKQKRIKKSFETLAAIGAVAGIFLKKK